MKKLKIRDLTLRDGQQSSFATRMNQNQVDRVLPFYKDAGFYAMEVWGGAVPDSVMRYLGENPWHRLEKIKAAVGDSSLLAALSRGRNLFGYAPYTDEIIEGFCRNSIEAGLGIMRIFDALNDVDNIKSTIKYVKKYGGMADCAICYTTDPKYPKAGFMDKLKGKKTPKPVFTDSYFADKARQMVALGADMITIKDMSGLIPPSRVWSLIDAMKKGGVNVPIDFHTHCTPGYGLASVIAAITAGAEIVDTNIWNFAGGPAAPAVELVYVFCKKMDIELGLDFEAIGRINEELREIRDELGEFDTVKKLPKPFDPLHDKLPTEIDAQFDRAIAAAEKHDEQVLVDACHKIESWFGFPPPNELVKRAQIPGGMYTNMVAQLKQFQSEDLLEKAMELIPEVRLDAGLPPLVTPTSQIVGAQAVNCALDAKKGKPKYTTVSNQFVSLVKGEYGKTPVPIDPEFRFKITGSREEVPYDTSKYSMQPNPVLEEYGGLRLAENEKEVLLLELFPMVAKDYLTKTKKARWEAMPEEAKKSAHKKAEHESAEGHKSASAKHEGSAAGASKHDEKSAEGLMTDSKAAGSASTAGSSASAAGSATHNTHKPGNMVTAPLPGRVIEVLVKVGDTINTGQDVLLLEAMKMENSITSDFSGTVASVMVSAGDTVSENTPLVEIV